MKDRHLAKVQVPLRDLAGDWASKVMVDIPTIDKHETAQPFTVIGAHIEPDGYLQGYIMLYLEGPKFPKCYAGGVIWCARYNQENEDA